jgi:hypothetical protein
MAAMNTIEVADDHHSRLVHPVRALSPARNLEQLSRPPLSADLPYATPVQGREVEQRYASMRDCPRTQASNSRGQM